MVRCSDAICVKATADLQVNVAWGLLTKQGIGHIFEWDTPRLSIL
jgi:hypothetical protein